MPFIHLAMAVQAVFAGAEPVDHSGLWITQDDYPAEALRQLKDGVVEIDVSIDQVGNPARCRVIRTSGTPVLDQTACAAILKRGRWKPTLDDAGKPVFATYRRKVKWVHPDGPRAKDVSGELSTDMEVEVAKLPVEPDRAQVTVRQIQSANGTAESCKVVVPSASPVLDRAACQLAAPLASIDPIADIAGNRVRGVRWRTIRFVAAASSNRAK